MALISPHFSITGGTAVKGDHARLPLGKRSDHMAESAHRRIEAEDEGNGEPVIIYLPLHPAGKMAQSR
jgi:hypothetical protein